MRPPTLQCVVDRGTPAGTRDSVMVSCQHKYVLHNLEGMGWTRFDFRRMQSQSNHHGPPVIALRHRSRIKTEEKAKVIAVGWGMYLNALLTI